MSTRDSGSPGPRRRRRSAVWTRAVLGAAAAILVLEGAAYLMIGVANRVLPQPILTRGAFYAGHAQLWATILRSAQRDRLHPTLGWQYQPGFQNETDAINLAGMRSSHEYALNPPDSLARIAAFGDSFVYCNEVWNAACWTAQLESG